MNIDINLVKIMNIIWMNSILNDIKTRENIINLYYLLLQNL